ncbi:hypothetical protein AX17_006085 [Amanita inopinata Kibby_2008]|nr:hypothetical protein AX17_006085 [Amanita inopinata Kibby_2008]
MSDAFADLWNSSAPSKPTAAKTLGSASTSQSTTIRRPQQDAFSLLSSGSSSLSTSSLNMRVNSQTRPTSAPQQKPLAANRNGANDAFGDLLGGSINSGSMNTSSRMTMAERAAQAEKQRLESLQRKQQAVKLEASTWQGLDSLASPTLSSLKTEMARNAAKPTLDNDDWAFGSVAKPQTQATPAQQSQLAVADDDWDLGDFAAPTKSSTKNTNSSTRNPPQSQTPWDLDDLMTAGSESSQTSNGLNSGSIRLPDDDTTGLLHQGLEEEDDILGVLGKPINSVAPIPRSDSRVQTPASQTTSNGRDTASRPVSPPPHILGQIVEMGFSVQQARVALAATDTGLDVQAALETLLSNGAASSSLPPSPTMQPPAPAALPRGQRDRVRERNRPSSSSSQRESERDANFQEQADKLLAQASEIGLNMLSKASVFWREGKERVQKVYEERSTSTGLVGGAKRPASGSSGRPKWMKEGTGEGHEDGDWKSPQETFKDEHGDHVLAHQQQGPSQQSIPPRPLNSSARPSSEQPNIQEANLLSNEPAFYVSPWRRGKPKAQAQVEAAQSPLKAPTPRAPSPIRAAPRANVVSASQSSISLSTQHKTRGGDKFKLGQYGEAEAAYSSAIATLPESHLLLVPLYNNRALTRLKTGDYAGAVEDATTVISIIGSGYHPSHELKVAREEEGASVDLADGLAKALRRRAEAWEGREKWEEAGKDWEALAAKEWAKANIRGEAVRGAGRCRRMVQASTSLSSPSSVQPAQNPRPPPRKRPAPPSRPPKPQVMNARPSEALSKLRMANGAAEAEDQARHELKDGVDAKLLAWKAGKETNIRALLGSLDAVLWPELELQKVGMAELVSPAQVKIRYTKTIAKLHPDKLNASNSTLEQRMLANGVFGTLSDAWNAFKQ